MVDFNAPLNNWGDGRLDVVTNMSSMFSGCKKFNQDLSSWGPHLGQVTNMCRMFWECREFNQNLSSWGGPHLEQVTNMYGMFRGCSNFDGTLESWNVSKVENMKYMFQNCMQFSGNGLDTWNWSNDPAVSSMRYMFFECRNFKPSLGNWAQVFNLYNNTLETVERMFYGCREFKGSGIQCWQLPESLVNNYRLSMSNMLYHTNITTLPWIPEENQIETFNGNNGNNGIAGRVGENINRRPIVFTREEESCLK